MNRVPEDLVQFQCATAIYTLEHCLVKSKTQQVMFGSDLFLKMSLGIKDVFEVADAKQIAAMSRRTFDKYISLVLLFRITV